MKFCGMCGAQMPDEAVICTNCGAPLLVSQVPQQPQQPDFQQPQQPDFPQQPYQQAYQQQPYQQQPYQQMGYQQQPYGQQMGYQQPYGQMTNVNPSAKGKAIGGLVCGIVGLVFSFFAWMSFGITAIIGLVLCIVGIVLSVKARNEMPLGVQGRSMATAGLVCGIIGAVLSGIIAVCTLCVLGCAACADAGAASAYAYNQNWYSILFM